MSATEYWAVEAAGYSTLRGEHPEAAVTCTICRAGCVVVEATAEAALARVSACLIAHECPGVAKLRAWREVEERGRRGTQVTAGDGGPGATGNDQHSAGVG